jgi:hypothetical protein
MNMAYCHDQVLPFFFPLFLLFHQTNLMEHKLALLTSLIIVGHEEHPYAVLTWQWKLKAGVLGDLPQHNTKPNTK